MIIRIYVVGLQYLAKEVTPEEAEKILSAYDNRDVERITINYGNDMWLVSKRNIVAIEIDKSIEKPEVKILN